MFTDNISIDAVEKLIDKSLLETDRNGKYWLHPLVREFAYDDLENKIEIHMLACQYYLSLPLPEKRTKKEDVQPLIEAHYHACMAKEYDKAASIIFDKSLYKDLGRWGNYRELVELYIGVLPEDHFRDKPLIDTGDHNAVLGNLGTAYRALGEVKKSVEYYEKALKIAQEIGDKTNESAWLGNLGNAYYSLGDVRKAVEYYEKALKIAQEIGDKTNESIWLGNLGIAYSALGDVRKASEVEYSEKALKIAQEIGDKKGEGALVGNLGTAYHDLGDVRKAVEYYEKALKLAQEIGDKNGEGRHLGNLGVAYSDLGDVKKAREYFEKALNIAQEIGDRRTEGAMLNNLGAALENEKKYKEALACYLVARDIRIRIEDPALKTTESNLADLKEKLGEKKFKKLEAEVAPGAEEIIRKLLEETSV